MSFCFKATSFYRLQRGRNVRFKRYFYTFVISFIYFMLMFPFSSNFLYQVSLVHYATQLAPQGTSLSSCLARIDLRLVILYCCYRLRVLQIFTASSLLSSIGARSK